MLVEQTEKPRTPQFDILLSLQSKTLNSVGHHYSPKHYWQQVARTERRKNAYKLLLTVWITLRSEHEA